MPKRSETSLKPNQTKVTSNDMSTNETIITLIELQRLQDSQTDWKKNIINFYDTMAGAKKNADESAQLEAAYSFFYEAIGRTGGKCLDSFFGIPFYSIFSLVEKCQAENKTPQKKQEIARTFLQLLKSAGLSESEINSLLSYKQELLSLDRYLFGALSDLNPDGIQAAIENLDDLKYGWIKEDSTTYLSATYTSSFLRSSYDPDGPKGFLSSQITLRYFINKEGSYQLEKVIVSDPRLKVLFTHTPSEIFQYAEYDVNEKSVEKLIEALTVFVDKQKRQKLQTKIYTPSELAKSNNPQILRELTAENKIFFTNEANQHKGFSQFNKDQNRITSAFFGEQFESITGETVDQTKDRLLNLCKKKGLDFKRFDQVWEASFSQPVSGGYPVTALQKYLRSDCDTNINAGEIRALEVFFDEATNRFILISRICMQYSQISNVGDEIGYTLMSPFTAVFVLTENGAELLVHESPAIFQEAILAPEGLIADNKDRPDLADYLKAKLRAPKDKVLISEILPTGVVVKPKSIEHKQAIMDYKKSDLRAVYYDRYQRVLPWSALDPIENRIFASKTALATTLTGKPLETFELPSAPRVEVIHNGGIEQRRSTARNVVFFYESGPNKVYAVYTDEAGKEWDPVRVYGSLRQFSERGEARVAIDQATEACRRELLHQEAVSRYAEFYSNPLLIREDIKSLKNECAGNFREYEVIFKNWMNRFSNISFLSSKQDLTLLAQANQIFFKEAAQDLPRLITLREAFTKQNPPVNAELLQKLDRVIALCAEFNTWSTLRPSRALTHQEAEKLFENTAKRNAWSQDLSVQQAAEVSKAIPGIYQISQVKPAIALAFSREIKLSDYIMRHCYLKMDFYSKFKVGGLALAQPVFEALRAVGGYYPIALEKNPVERLESLKNLQQKIDLAIASGTAVKNDIAYLNDLREEIQAELFHVQQIVHVQALFSEHQVAFNSVLTRYPDDMTDENKNIARAQRVGAFIPTYENAEDPNRPKELSDTAKRIAQDMLNSKRVLSEVSDLAKHAEQVEQTYTTLNKVETTILGYLKDRFKIVKQSNGTWTKTPGIEYKSFGILMKSTNLKNDKFYRAVLLLKFIEDFKNEHGNSSDNAKNLQDIEDFYAIIDVFHKVLEQDTQKRAFSDRFANGNGNSSPSAEASSTSQAYEGLKNALSGTVPSAPNENVCFNVSLAQKIIETEATMMATKKAKSKRFFPLFKPKEIPSVITSVATSKLSVEEALTRHVRESIRRFENCNLSETIQKEQETISSYVSTLPVKLTKLDSVEAYRALHTYAAALYERKLKIFEYVFKVSAGDAAAYMRLELSDIESSLQNLSEKQRAMIKEHAQQIRNDIDAAISTHIKVVDPVRRGEIGRSMLLQSFVEFDSGNNVSTQEIKESEKPIYKIGQTKFFVLRSDILRLAPREFEVNLSEQKDHFVKFSQLQRVDFEATSEEIRTQYYLQKPKEVLEPRAKPRAGLSLFGAMESMTDVDYWTRMFLQQLEKTEIGSTSAIYPKRFLPANQHVSTAFSMNQAAEINLRREIEITIPDGLPNREEIADALEKETQQQAYGLMVMTVFSQFRSGRGAVDEYDQKLLSAFFHASSAFTKLTKEEKLGIYHAKADELAEVQKDRVLDITLAANHVMGLSSAESNKSAIARSQSRIVIDVNRAHAHISDSGFTKFLVVNLTEKYKSNKDKFPRFNSESDRGVAASWQASRLTV